MTLGEQHAATGQDRPAIRSLLVKLQAAGDVREVHAGEGRAARLQVPRSGSKGKVPHRSS